MGYTVPGYQPENVENTVSTVMRQSSSGQRYHVTGTHHSYGCTSHHSLSPEFAGFAGDPSVGVGRAWLVLPSCLLKVATQHPGRSSSVSQTNLLHLPEWRPEVGLGTRLPLVEITVLVLCLICTWGMQK